MQNAVLVYCRYRSDPWLWDLDWTVKPFRIKKPKPLTKVTLQLYTWNKTKTLSTWALSFLHCLGVLTGYNQRVTHINSVILILKLNSILLRKIYIKMKCGAQWSQIQFEDEDHAFYMSFRWVTTTCLRWEPLPVTL